MTPKEALNKLDETVIGDLEWKIVLSSTLEKQIPKKPFVPCDSLNKTPYCPNCEEDVWGCDAYCDHCGQALDWGDSE